MTEQNYGNHAKLVPTFHFFVLPVLALNVVQSIIRLVRMGINWNGIVAVLTAVALLFLAFHARLFALKVQDRVIRLEERQRLSRLLPAGQQGRIEEFTTAQLVGLRFASDAELPELARRVLEEKVTDLKRIKQSVKQWRGDYLRA
jgi:hypothetical protein